MKSGKVFLMFYMLTFLLSAGVLAFELEDKEINVTIEGTKKHEDPGEDHPAETINSDIGKTQASTDETLIAVSPRVSEESQAMFYQGDVEGHSDLGAPKIAIISPNDGEALKGTVTIRVSASDDTGVEYVRIEDPNTKTGIDKAKPPYEIEWDTTKSPDGDHEIHAWAVDMAGYGSDTQITVKVQNQGGQ